MAGRRCRIKRDYQVAYKDLGKVTAGQELTIRERKGPWPGWLWCVTTSGGRGWIPKTYVVEIEGGFKADRDYESRELNVQIGQEVELVLEESGRVWVVDGLGHSGWIPLSHIEII